MVLYDTLLVDALLCINFFEKNIGDFLQYLLFEQYFIKAHVYCITDMSCSECLLYQGYLRVVDGSLVASVTNSRFMTYIRHVYMTRISHFVKNHIIDFFILTFYVLTDILYSTLQWTDKIQQPQRQFRRSSVVVNDRTLDSTSDIDDENNNNIIVKSKTSDINEQSKGLSYLLYVTNQQLKLSKLSYRRRRRVSRMTDTCKQCLVNLLLSLCCIYIIKRITEFVSYVFGMTK